MTRKFQFYQRYGVEEYYAYDPERGELAGWLRQGSELREIPDMSGWISPRLGIRFDLVNGELHLSRPDGRLFATFVELEQQREEAQRQAERERQAKEEERLAKEQERQAKELAQQRVERLAAQLRALGVEPEP